MSASLDSTNRSNSPSNSPSNSQSNSQTHHDPFIQVIDEAGNFTANEQELSGLVCTALFNQSLNLSTNQPIKQSINQSVQQSINYSVIGIMGCQSTGKSTLLNALFGCHFRCMDAMVGRGQTTKGVWVDMGETDVMYQSIKQTNNQTTPTITEADPDRMEDDETMDSSSQPTNQPQALLIMDLEGTDSGERGEDRTTFERQTSLFALSINQLMIINLWEHDIGRYTASNYGILKTIFEVHLNLIDAQMEYDSSNKSTTSTQLHKKMLLFVIRDHIESDTPLERLIEKIRTEIDSIWGEVRKPERLTNQSIDQLFVFDYVSLPHMKLEKQAFVQSINNLRSRFVDPADPNYFFNALRQSTSQSSTVSINAASVPAESFGRYVHSVWSTIQSNKQLNLPTQKEMLATYRADETISQSINQFKQQFESLRLQALGQSSRQSSNQTNNQIKQEHVEVKSEVVPLIDNFGQTIHQLITQAINQYDQLTAFYHPEIISSKRVVLIERLIDCLMDSFKSQCDSLLHGAYQAFNQSINQSMFEANQDESNIDEDFQKHVNQSIERSKEYIATNRSKIEIPAFDESESNNQPINQSIQQQCSIEQVISDRLMTMINEKIEKERVKQIERLQTINQSKLKTMISQSINQLLRQAPSTMWYDIYDQFNQSINQIRQSIESKSKTLMLQQSEIEHSMTQLINQSFNQFHTMLDQHASLISLHLRKRFDALFRSDEDGFIRRWRQHDDVRQMFKQSIKQSSELIKLFAYDRLPLLMKFDGVLPLDIQQAMDHMNDQAVLDFVKQLKDRSINQSILLIDQLKRADVEHDFTSDMEVALREAESEQERLRASRRLPPWGLALIAFLGFDELMSLLRNPLLFTLLLIVGGGLYFAYSTGLLVPVTHVVYRLIRQACGIAQQQGLDVTWVIDTLGLEQQRGSRFERDEEHVMTSKPNEVEMTRQTSARSRVAHRAAKAMTITDPTAVRAEIDRVVFNQSRKHSTKDL